MNVSFTENAWADHPCASDKQKRRLRSIPKNPAKLVLWITIDNNHIWISFREQVWNTSPHSLKCARCQYNIKWAKQFFLAWHWEISHIIPARNIKIHLVLVPDLRFQDDAAEPGIDFLNASPDGQHIPDIHRGAKMYVAFVEQPPFTRQVNADEHRIQGCRIHSVYHPVLIPPPQKKTVRKPWFSGIWSHFWH